MPINFGSSSIKEIYFGSTSIGTVYFGNTLVWQKTAPPGGPTPTLDLDFKQAWGAAINDAVVIGPPALLTHTRASAVTGFDQNGVLQTAATNAPAFVHDPGRGNAAQGLLVESAGTNECLHSHEFDNAVWELVTGGTVTANTDNGPDGTLSADRLEDNNGVDYGTIRQSVVVTNNTDPWTWSIFVKKDADQTRFPEFQFRFGGQHNAQLNTQTGEVGVRSGSFNELYTEDYGDFWRLVMVKNNAGVSSVDLYILPAVSSVWLGASSATTGSVICYGSQLEHAASPSSYIATTTAPATRSAVWCRTQDVSWFNSGGPMTAYQALTPFHDFGVSQFSLDLAEQADPNGNRIQFNVRDELGAAVVCFCNSNPGEDMSRTMLDVITYGQELKMAMGVATNDGVMYANGVSGGTDTLVNVPATVDRMGIGSKQSGTTGMRSTAVGRVSFYDTRFTDEELATLTLPDPTLDLDFALNWGSLINDAVKTGPASFLTHTRASAASGFDESGVLQTAANDAPVFDHDPGNGNAAKGILIEEARTNEITFSSDFSDSSWSKWQSVVTANDETAPDGTLTASKHDDQQTDQEGALQKNNIPVADDTSTWTFSIYIKKTSGDAHYCSILLRYQQTVSIGIAVFDTNTGTVSHTGGLGAVSGAIDCGAYWRLWIAHPNPGGNTTVRAQFQPAYNTDGSGTVDNTATGFKHIWGAMLENAASPSSYIATTSSPATRSATELYGGPDVSWYANGKPGSIYTSSLGPPAGATFYRFGESGGGNPVYYEVISGADVRVNGNVTTGNDLFVIQGVAPVWGAPLKTALGINQDDAAFSVNGNAVVTDVTHDLENDPSINRLNIGKVNFGTYYNGHFTAWRYYPMRLADSVLQDITT